MKKILILLVTLIPFIANAQREFPTGLKVNSTLTIGTNGDINTTGTIRKGSLSEVDSVVPTINGVRKIVRDGNTTIPFGKVTFDPNDTLSLDTAFHNVHLTGISTAPTATAGTNTTQIATTEFAVMSSSANLLKGITAMGGSTKVTVLGANGFGYSNTNINDGVLYVMTVYIDKPQTITGLCFTLQTQGNFTSDNFNGFGLFSVSAGVNTQVAITSNSDTPWKTGANSKVKVAFTSPYSASPGIYRITLLYNESAHVAIPVMYTCLGNSQNCLDQFELTNSNFFYGTIAAQSTMPTSFNSSSVTPIATPFSVVLY
jgi:hypothetical protein